MVWPSAARAWDLLNGVQLKFENQEEDSRHSPGGQKRQAEVAFAAEKSSDYLQREAFGGLNSGSAPTPVTTTVPVQSPEPGVHDLSTRIMAHMLGLDIPGIEPSTSFYPGYEWWPRNGQGQGGSQPLSPAAPGPIDANTLPPPMTTNGSEYGQGNQWMTGPLDGSMPYMYNFNQYGL